MYLNEAIQRINNIKWDIVGINESKELTNLGYEFLRRLANFYKEESIQPRPPLFANIAKLSGDIGEEVDISYYCNSSVVEFLGEDIYKINIIKYYIQLAKYADKYPDMIKYLSVYEPLIKVLEINGLFDLRLRSLDIKKVAHFPLDGWYERFVAKEPINIDEL